MFPGDRYDYESTKAINKYKYIKSVLLIVASVAFSAIIFWPSIKDYFKKVYPSVVAVSIPTTKSSLLESEAKNSAKDIRFFGTDKSNQPYLLIADSGYENQNGIVFMTKPQLTLNLQSGNIATLTAIKGDYDKNKELIKLVGEVVVTHSLGYQFVTSMAWIDLTKLQAYGDQYVHGEGPHGTIDAQGGFRLSDKEDKITFLGRPELILRMGEKQ